MIIFSAGHVTPKSGTSPGLRMTSLDAATARWAYVQCNVNEAILIADRKDVCVCVLPITNAHNDVRPLLLECCAEAAYVYARDG